MIVNRNIWATIRKRTIGTYTTTPSKNKSQNLTSFFNAFPILLLLKPNIRLMLKCFFILNHILVTSCVKRGSFHLSLLRSTLQITHSSWSYPSEMSLLWSHHSRSTPFRRSGSTMSQPSRCLGCGSL